MKTFKTRHQFYLDDDLSAKLDALAAKPGASKTAILTDALAAWIDRRATNELDQRFGGRLDRQSRSAERLERKIDTVAEALGTFVQYQLTLTAHQPAFEEATRKLGLERYQAFIELVSERRARDRTPKILATPPTEENENGREG